MNRCHPLRLMDTLPGRPGVAYRAHQRVPIRSHRVMPMKCSSFITVKSVAMLLLLVSHGISSTPAAIHPLLDFGSVCIAGVPKPASGDTSLSNPTGGGRTLNYSIQIDKRPVTQVSNEKATLVSGLELKGRHLIKIRRDGKVVESFWFSFEKEGSKKLCLWFKPLYETWSLWPAEEGGKKCRCE